MSAFKLLVEGGKDVMLFEITLTKIKHKKNQTDRRTDRQGDNSETEKSYSR